MEYEAVCESLQTNLLQYMYIETKMKTKYFRISFATILNDTLAVKVQSGLMISNSKGPAVLVRDS